MDLIDALLLGVLQGLTEFLPVSSSGHLVLGEALLGVRMQGIAFEVAVHLATAGAVVLAYRKRILAMLKALRLFLEPGAWRKSRSGDELQDSARENFLLDIYLLISTVPAGIIGVLLKDKIESAFKDPRLVCLMLLITGLILASSRFSPKTSRLPLTWWRALLVGTVQAAALLPGISRSGTTITAGLFLGLGPGKSAEFSFLLALPAILGASIVEFSSRITTVSAALPGLGALAVGTVTAFISGFTAIFFLLKTLQKGKFDRFAYYCWAVGLLGILLL
ncbi:MAG TPA: undecaprenyl-diphosphate phosphatase [archaeon]|nr:undecaprenyl-diphosphate phosphatase [archaeon]